MRRMLIVGVVAWLLAGCVPGTDAPASTEDAPVKGTAADPAAATAKAARPGSPAAVAPTGKAVTSAGEPDEASRELLGRMRNDLRYLMSAQEVHFAENFRYAGPAEDINQIPNFQYRTEAGVTVRVVDGSERGWSAVAHSTELPGRGCAIYVGDVTPPSTPGGRQPSGEGMPECDQ